ncbi:hypothetical protein GOP47_0013420 [Adiantum capillus-veneris]|uniref:5'-3' exonuclease domain-containing protein n=1 Tax=Adiantum capillus-veneris TaxID=13818 RepID=A0A9D4ZDE0_ADICA|nr:hypothetical protein GOP47_0013420 [Adiantum capillus-veneris]
MHTRESVRSLLQLLFSGRVSKLSCWASKDRSAEKNIGKSMGNVSLKIRRETGLELAEAIFCSRVSSLAMKGAKFPIKALQVRQFHGYDFSTFAKEHCPQQFTSRFSKSSPIPKVCTNVAVSGSSLNNNPLITKYKVSIACVSSGQNKKLAALPDDQPLVQQSTAASTTNLPQETATSKENRVILIDGKAVVYRAYYKITAKLQHGGQISGTSGDSDWVLTVFTALSTVLKVFELMPSHIAVVFDHEGLTFRHTMFSDYKSNRSPTPDTVVQSLQYIKPALTAMGIKTVEVPGVEADDVIGTLALSAIKAEAKVRVVSPDKDFFQLISPSLRLLRFVPRGSGIVSFGLEEFQERFGDLNPSQFVDVLALTGDRIDNIPGVPGIGEKTAVKLIKLYGSLENLIKERSTVKGKLASSGLLADKGEVFLNKRLVTLRTDLPHYIIPLSLDDFVYKQPQDGGDHFFNLVKAMGSFVNGPFVTDLEERTKSLWLRY